MPERVLPSASILAIIGEPIGDKLVDLSQRQHLIPRRPDRHRCQRNIRIWRLLVAVSIPRWSRHLPANSSSPRSLQNTYTPRVSPTFLIERVFFFLLISLLSSFCHIFLSLLIFSFLDTLRARTHCCVFRVSCIIPMAFSMVITLARWRSF